MRRPSPRYDSRNMGRLGQSGTCPAEPAADRLARGTGHGGQNHREKNAVKRWILAATLGCCFTLTGCEEELVSPVVPSPAERAAEEAAKKAREDKAREAYTQEAEALEKLEKELLAKLESFDSQIGTQEATIETLRAMAKNRTRRKIAENEKSQANLDSLQATVEKLKKEKEAATAELKKKVDEQRARVEEAQKQLDLARQS